MKDATTDEPRPAKPRRWPKRVKLRRVGDEEVRDLEGILARPLVVGERLVLWYGEQHRLVSSKIRSVRIAAGELHIDTRSSWYVVRFLNGPEFLSDAA